MDQRDNMVPFPAGPRNDQRAPTQDPVAKKLEALRKVPVADRHLFARNLGEMAATLNPKRPKQGAKAMFDRAFTGNAAANWLKRSRYIRLPDEGTDSSDDAVYVATTASYTQLAKAYAKLKSPDDPLATREALRRLIKQTSLAPGVQAQSPTDDGVADAQALLKAAVDKVCSEPELAKALAYLRMLPITGRFEELPDGSIACRFAIKDRGFDPVAKPRRFAFIVPLGWTYHPRKIVCVPLCGSEAEYRIQYSETLLEGDDELYAAIDLDVQAALPTDFSMGDEYVAGFDEVPDHLTRTIHDRCLVYLHHETGDGESNTGIGITPYYLLRDWHGWFSLYEGESTDGEVWEIGGTHAQDRTVFEGRTDSVDGSSGGSVMFEIFDVEKSFHLINDEDKIMAISGVERLYTKDVTDFTVPLTDQRAADILGGSLGGQTFRFRPRVWDDPTRLAPARYDSIAATILRNLAFAPGGERIDDLFRRQLEIMLTGLNEFVDAQLGPYYEAVSSVRPLTPSL